MPISATCSCGKVYTVPASFAGQKATCKACGAIFQVPGLADGEAPAEAPSGAGEPAAPAATALYDSSPAMFRNHPLLFTAGIVLPLLVLIFGLSHERLGGLAVLGTILLLAAGVYYVFWWLSCRATRLTVTDRKVMLRRGLLTKDVNEIRHDDVRNVRVVQNLLQRLLGVGNIGISTAGQSGVEIEVNGLPNPHRVREIINQNRR